MTNAAFDTLKFLQKLKAGGMPEQQAIALTEAQNEAFMESTDHMMATKADVLNFRQEIKQDMVDLRQELKQDMVDLKQELKQDMVDLRQEFKHDLTELRTEVKIELVCVNSTLKLHNWMIGFVLTGIGALILKAFFT